MSKPQASKRERNIKRIEAHHGHQPEIVDLEQRRTESLKQALFYLEQKPPRISLARFAIKAALDVEGSGWLDP